MESMAEEGQSEMMADLLAEMEILAAKYKKHHAYGEAAPGFGYQDPDTRAENRATGNKDWNKKTKKFHNMEYYSANRGEQWGVEYDGPVGKYWDNKKKTASDFLADDILSEDEFAELLAEIEAGGKGSGGNNKGTRAKINEYGEAAPGFGYQDPDTRAENRATGNKDWNKKTKGFYNKNYYSANRGKVEGWPMPANPRVAEHLGEEEAEMLAEMLAEMEAQEAVSNDEQVLSELLAELEAEEAMSSKKASAKKTQKVVEDAMGLSGKTAKIDPKLARIFAAAEEEEETEEETEEEEAPAPAKKSKPQEVQMTEESDEDEEDEEEEEEES
jgi:hypothetical protein